MTRNDETDPALKTKVQWMAEQKLEGKLRQMNAQYHHHFHNAIVGHGDPDVRYNAKWLDSTPQ